MIKLIKKAKKIKIIFGCLALVVLLGVADVKTGEFIDFSFLYFLPIVISSWFLGQRSTIVFVLISTFSWLYSEWSIGTRYQETHSFFINGLLLLISFLFLVVLIGRLKKEIKISAENKIIREKEETIIKTSQSICGLIGQHVAAHNSEIIDWVNTRKNSGHQVSDKVDKSSQAIGKNIHILTEMSFYDIYNGNNVLEVDSLMEDLKNRLNNIEENINKKDEKNNKLNQS